jgi:capsular exopolysaccharide synthesis family protein
MALLGVLGALAFSLWQRPVYRATASVEVGAGNDDLLRGAGSGTTPASGSLQGSVQTEAALLLEDSLIEQVILALRLDRSPEFASPKDFDGWVRARLGLEKSPLGTRRMAQAIAALRENLAVEVPREGNVIRIHYDAHDPVLAANVANKLAGTLIEQKLQARLDTTRQIAEWLNPELTELRKNLDQSELDLQRYAQSKGLLFTGAGESIGAQNLRLLQEEYIRARADLAAKQSQYEVTAAGPATTAALGVEDRVLQENQLKLTELRRQLAELSSVLKPENYKVARVQAQIVALETEIREERDRGRTKQQQNYEAAKTKEQMLSKAYAEQSAFVSDQTVKGTRYDSLKREVEVNSHVYEAMMQKAKEAGIMSAVRPSNIRMITVAQPPSQPFKPSLPLNLGVGLFVGLTFGIAYVAASAHSDKRLHTPGEAEQYLNLPELGAIPKNKHSSLARLHFSKSHARGFEVAAWAGRTSAFSESIRATMTSLLFAGGTTGAPKIFAVTSSLPGEGKTTVVSNLGAALAEIDGKVLLIDADFRAPQLHKVFSLDNSRGLSDLLTGEDNPGSGALHELIQGTEIPNLSVLTSGPAADRLTSLIHGLHGPRLKQIFDRLRDEFDHVVVDASPSLVFADARIIARSTDGVVLVLRANQTSWPTAAIAAQRLQMDGVQILGTILNGWRPGAGVGAHGYRDFSKYYPVR